MYTSPLTAPGFFSVQAFYLLYSLGLGGVLCLPAMLSLDRLEKGYHAVFSSGHKSRSDLSWRVAFFLLFLAAIPLPLYLLTGRAAARITDTEQMVLFGAAAAVLALAAAVVLAAVLAAVCGWIVRGLPGVSRPVPFAWFWLLAFPTPWLAIPLLVIASQGQSLSSAAVLIFPLACPALVPGLRPWLSRLQPLVGFSVAALLLVVSLAFFALAAAGVGFDKAPVLQAPFSSRVFAYIHDKVDRDSDGYSAMFDGLDCDDLDPAVHRMAHDIPGNDVDENCDGEDATEVGQSLFGNRVPFPVKRAKKYNVLFILVDALRADHLSFNGYKRKTAPNIERLARESLNFTQAYSQYSSTGISLPSMLSGVYPEYMKWGKPRGAKDFLVHKDNRLLPEVLGEAGYVTGAVLVPWVSNNVRGLKQRFQHHAPLYPPKEWRKYVRNSSPVSVTKSIEFFESLDGDKPYFLFLHMEDPHRPYVNHKPPGVKFGKKAIDRYDSDIYWTDLWLGFLFGYLKEKGLLEETIVILLADHGEEFREHGKKHHGHQLYQESIWIPLIVKYPGVKPKKVATPVGLVDVFPTILDLTGLEHPRDSLQGQSLLHTAASPESSDSRPIFTMLADRTAKPTHHLKGVILGHYKLIWDMTNDSEELFDLDSDPRERKNLAKKKKKIARKLRTLLQDFLSNSDSSWKRY